MTMVSKLQVYSISCLKTKQDREVDRPKVCSSSLGVENIHPKQATIEPFDVWKVFDTSAARFPVVDDRPV